MVKTLASAVLHGPETYHGHSVKNPSFLQEIIHISAFINGLVCNLSTGELLCVNAEAFCVEMGILFSLTATKYNENTFACYMPTRWYKVLWQFNSNILYKLNLLEDYPELHWLRKKDVYQEY